MSDRDDSPQKREQGTVKIEVASSVYRRFEEEREKTEQHDAPKMDQSTFLSHMIDTRKAVQQGYYNDE